MWIKGVGYCEKFEFIGKKTTNLDTANIIGIAENDNTVYDDLPDKILEIRSIDSYKFGISRSNLISLEKRIRENKMLRLQKYTLQKLKRTFSNAISENFQIDNRNDVDHMIAKEVIMK